MDRVLDSVLDLLRGLGNSQFEIPFLSRLTAYLVNLLRTLFERWGYWVVFLGPCLENLVFLGAVVPGVFVLLLAGFGAHDNLIDLRLAVPLAALGTSLGDTASYAMGRFGWRRALAHTEQLPMISSVRSAFLRRTGLFVLSYHFLGYTRMLGPITAGALRIPFKRWWLLDALGATLWVTVYMVGGYVVADVFNISLDTADENMKKFERLMLILVVITIGSFAIVRARSGWNRTGGSPVEPGADSSTSAGDDPPVHRGTR